MTAIIFDMDGVLIDSQPLHYEIDMRVIKACGYPAELSTVTPYTGISNPDRWPKYKDTLKLSPQTEELIKMSEEAMRDIFANADITAITGIQKLLQNLKAMEIPTGVASSSSHELIQMVLTRAEIGQYFDVIISGEEVEFGKPNPDIYLKAANKIGLSPEKCIAIEDAPAGILAAKNAGLTCIAYKNPNTYGQVFTHADYVVEKYDECIPIIDRLKRRNK